MKNYLFFIAFLIFVPLVQAQVITVSTTEYTNEELVTEVLINSPCAIVDNISTVTGTNFGLGNGIGYFENTNPNFPMQNGVILATGSVNDAPGPNTSNTFAGGGWPGDPQLFNYIQNLGIDPGLTSYNDATIMEFDFTPLTDSISFNFVFGSNEYGTFQCSFSDAFAFFLEDMVTGDIVNMALVPDTPGEVPISVTTIRDQTHNGSCSSENPEFFDVFYGATGQPPASAPVNLNGLTVLMQAWQFVTPNNPYRMKLVVADRNDSSWDSAVFIEGGSFFIGSADLGEDLTVANGNAPCDDEEVILSVDTSPDSIITWFFNGDIIPDENGPELIVTVSGTYGVEIQNPDAPDCIITDEVIVEFITAPIVDLGDDILVCDNVFAVLDATPLNINDLGGATYEWFFNGELIPGENEPTLEVTEVGDYTAEVTSDLGCLRSDTVSVIIVDFTVDLGDDTIVCEDTFEIIPTIEGINPADATYLWSTGETTPTITVSENGNYSVEVTFSDCVETDDINLTFAPQPLVDLGGNVFFCDELLVTLDATPENINDLGSVTYEWFFNGDLIVGENEATLEVTEVGNYAVEVTSDLNCVASDAVSVDVANYTVDLGEDIVLCDGESYEIIPVIEGIDPSQASFLWSTGETSFSIVVTESGNYSLDVIYFNCVESDTVSVNFRNNPEVNLGENTLKCAQEILTLNATPSNETSENVTYTWFFNGGVITGATSPTLDVTDAGIYAVEVSDDGCIGVDDIVVSFYANENCVITQGISPNNDGLNDCFDLQFLNDKSGPLELVILNRHGRVVFEQNNYVDEWCGQSDDGEALPVGNYFYVIKIQNEDPLTGYIYLNK
tara:strand:- start:18111 stop:20636 length:2526 start_codon:yes stop_codon:yes gene_type:complete